MAFKVIRFGFSFSSRPLHSSLLPPLPPSLFSLLSAQERVCIEISRDALSFHLLAFYSAHNPEAFNKQVLLLVPVSFLVVLRQNWLAYPNQNPRYTKWMPNSWAWWLTAFIVISLQLCQTERSEQEGSLLETGKSMHSRVNNTRDNELQGTQEGKK